MSHETLSRNTRAQLEQVFDALRELMMLPVPPKRPIGFVTPSEGKGKKAKAGTGSDCNVRRATTPNSAPCVSFRFALPSETP